MKIDPRQMLVGLVVVATLVIAPPAVVYAVGAVDTGIDSRSHGTVVQPAWVAVRGSLTDVHLDDNDNHDDDDNDNDDNDNDDAVDNGAAVVDGNNGDPGPAPDSVDPNPTNNDPNNNGDGNNGGGGDNGGGGSDPSSGVSGD